METKKPAPVTVLVVDDEPQIRRFLKVALEPHGYATVEAATGSEGLAQAAMRRPEVVILDLGLPDIDGAEVLKRLREWYDKAIVILSVREDEGSIVAALDAGADDYLTKPFNLAELLARIRTAQRHHGVTTSEPVFRAGPLTVDLATRKVSLSDQEIRLTVTEYDVLRVFIRHAGRVLTHAQILKEVWGPNASEHVQYLRVYVGHLRHKIEVDPSQPQFIVTEPGVGYRFQVPREA